MGKKTGVFTEGQLVYAKVKGYSPWPAKITKVISKHKYGVYFYGTGETGNCKSEELDPYDDKNRSRFNTDRQMKKPDYKEAVDQIELAAKGSDPAPIITADESIKNSEEQNGDIEDTTMKTDDETSQTNDFDPDESQLQIAEEVPKSTPAPKKKAVNKPKAVSTPIIHAQQPPVDQSETKENDEKVSRSGRKIKEKKINNDEMDPDEVFTQPRKRLKIDSENRKPVQHLNDSAINDFCISKMQILQDPVRKQFLTVQFEMIKTIQDIKQTLGLEHVDVDRALDLCQQFKDKILPNITKLMILKFSNTVITIKRLRNYIGNFTSWNLDETQLVDFKEKAKLIREVASDMYNSLKKLFPEAPEKSSFWQFYADEHKNFQEKYQKLDVSDLFEAFNEEELELFASKLTNNHDAEVPQLSETVQSSENEQQ